MGTLNQKATAHEQDVNYSEAFQQAPLGLLILDQQKVIRAWNQWLSDKTDLHQDKVVGQRLGELFPETENERFNFALQEVINNNSHQVMSHVLNKFLIPIKIDYTSHRDHEIDNMPQQVYLAPIRHVDEVQILVSIVDVTEAVYRVSKLTEMAEQLEEESLTDQLTGAYNRRFLWQWLEQQKKHLERYHIPQSFLLLDIDHFKLINDNLGHDTGDIILKEFNREVDQLLRDTDLLIRYGGEEFLVLLTQANIEVAGKTAERIRKHIEQLTFYSLKPGEVTCSIGVASWNIKEGVFDPTLLLKEADQALYYAKRNGRNQISLSLTEGSSE
jgi:diguanylate cyclase